MKSFKEKLVEQCGQANSRLCVGLDIDVSQLMNIGDVSLDALKLFTQMVIDSTIEHTAVFKLNFAFYERYGSKGFSWLEETVKYIDSRRLTIADAKRGDIGNTANQYASSIFDHFGFDAVTVNPYMGTDAILPFSEYKEKGVFVLCLTSNKGSRDLQLKEVDGKPLYFHVIEMVKEINEHENCGLVIGATHPEELIGVRQNASDMPLLIPGIGAQGGDLESCVREGNTNGLALINVSRGILYASNKDAESIHNAAKEYNDRINQVLKGEPANV